MSAATILWIGHPTFIASATAIVACLAWSAGRASGKAGAAGNWSEGYDSGHARGKAAGYREGKADGERIGHARALMESQAALDRIARES